MSREPGYFRARTNGSGGYTNGFSSDRERGYGQYDAPQERPSFDRRRDRRPGGYGGFDAEDRDDDTPHVARPTSLERSQAHRRSGSSGKTSPDRRRQGAGRSGPGAQQMEEVLLYIQQNWEFMTNDTCVPIQTALKLLDSSSLGLANQYDRFQQTYDELQRALKAIVNEHHQGFNSSIGTFHMIQNSIQNSQNRVRHLKDSLTQAKSYLSTTKPELKEYATASQNYDEMIQVLNVIEQLQQVPDKLEARISEKRFLSAVEILQDALRMIRRSEMENIGALSDLRIYLSNQEHSLTDILIEELHNHLYLMSPYCEDRWKIYAQNQLKSNGPERTQAELRGRSMFYFLDGLNTSEPMTDDSPRNPEADTFQYLQLLVESLNKMSRLEIAVDTIEQRLPAEMFKVVEKSNNEVAQRHPSILRAYATKRGNQLDPGVDNDELRSELLNDLLWTLYARFEAIAESYRVVHDVITGITKREGLGTASGSPLARGFKELWRLYQNEIRVLLHDYLATDGDSAYRGRQGPASSGSVFSRAARNKDKRMFKLTDMDTKSEELTSQREDLEFILKSSVPGLVSDSKRPDDLSANQTNNLDGSAGHKLLIEPSVFNMGVLLPPSLDFLTRLKEVVPPNSDIVLSTLTTFLDEFLVNVFQPQLEETLDELCAQTFIEVDAFQQDPEWTRHSKKPIFKGTAKFFALVTTFCKMLDNIPHDQAFSQLLVSQLVTYYEKCNGWYKALVSRMRATPRGRRLKASAAFAESGDIADAVSSLFQAGPDATSEWTEREIALLIEAVDADPLDDADLIQDKKMITSLCMLYTSMKWLATRVAQLRFISDRATDSNSREPGNRHNRRWTLLSSNEPRLEGLPVYLPLNNETAATFDKVVTSYQSLSTLVLRSLHIELRTHILYSLTTSIHSSYALDIMLNEPSPAILTLNNALISFDAEVSTYIPAPTYPSLTSGLSHLMDTYLLTLSRKITTMNANGCALMQLNILVLQQNLKNIEAEASLPLSALFFDMFTAGPEAIVARAKEYGKGFGVEGGKFGDDVVKGLVELWYADKLKDERREVGLQARRQMEAQLLEITEFMY